MQKRLGSLVWSCISLGCLIVASSALAQNNPELGDVSPAPPPQPVAASGRVTVRSSGPFDGAVARSGTDHASVVGHLGVGAFGTVALPRPGSTAAGGDFNETLDAPTIGARYWLDERLGLEGGLGLAFVSGGVTTEMGNTSTEFNDPHLFGFALHAGLPLALATSDHFTFQFVPEFNFGFVVGGQDTGVAANDVSLSAVMLQLGARVGAEIHFGFIGIPQLSLQGTVGLHLTYQGRSASTDNQEISSHSFSFGTTVQDSPWRIFTSNLAAIYYF